MEIEPNLAVDFLLKNAGLYAQAKADRVHLEEFRKCKKALLMKDAESCGVKASASQERDAYAHADYQQLLDALKTAVEIEEKLRWQLIAAQMRVEIWRTTQANNRFIDKATQ